MSSSQTKASIPIKITSTTSSPTPQSSSFKNVLFHELHVTISSAKLAGKESASTEPDVYAELFVDDNPVYKTECQKATFSPKWEAEFPVLVTPYSKLTFKVFHKTATNDNLVGESSFNLYDQLKRYNGKIDALSMPLVLDRANGASKTSVSYNHEQQSTSLAGSEETDEVFDRNKPNFLYILMTGLETDMSHYPPKSRSVSPNVTVVDGQENSKHNSKSKGEKHSTRSLPRLFRGSSSKQSNNGSTTAPSPSLNANEPTTVGTTDDTQVTSQVNSSLVNGFQSLTLPRWSLNDPSPQSNSSTAANNSSSSPYPRQPPPVPQHATLPSAAHGNTPSGQYPAQPHLAAFTITNNSNQAQSATVTTTEFQEELPPGWE